MDELRMLAEMRKQVPADNRYAAAGQVLAAEIAGVSTVRQWRVRRPILIGGLMAATVAASAVVVATSSDTGDGRTRVPSPANAQIRLVAVTDPMSLAANATAVAQRAPVPAATQWIYLKLESTTSDAPPSGAQVQKSGSHVTKEEWIQVDHSSAATVKGGKVSMIRLAGAPLGWPSPLTYSYLITLPTDSEKLLEKIKKNIVSGHSQRIFGGSDSSSPSDGLVFDSVIALMENYPMLPPKLNAALYGVLARLKAVHLGHQTDIAGRQVLSLDHVEDNIRSSILISANSYAYAGQKRVVVRDSRINALDGGASLHEGEVLADEAILVSEIVNNPGMRRK